jgi:excisionase family DNA binding protein
VSVPRGLLFSMAAIDSHLSVIEVAALLGVDPRTVRSDIRAGRLPAKRVGRRGLYRIDPADLERLVEPVEERRAQAPSRGPGPVREPAGEFSRLARAMTTLPSPDDSTERAA